MRVNVDNKDTVKIFQLSNLVSVAEMRKDFKEETVQTESGEQIVISANVERVELKTRANLLGEVLSNFEYYFKLGQKEEYEELGKNYTGKVQKYMDDTAATRNYDGIASACSYATSTDAKFKSEATACVAWRDSVWVKCYSVLNDVTAGKRDIPTWEELLAELPKLEW